MKSERIRIHGDYHLGQVLVANDDFSCWISKANQNQRYRIARSSNRR